MVKKTDQLFLLAVLAVGVCASATYAQSDTPETLQTAKRAGDFESAIELYSEAATLEGGPEEDQNISRCRSRISDRAKLKAQGY